MTPRKIRPRPEPREQASPSSSSRRDHDPWDPRPRQWCSRSAGIGDQGQGDEAKAADAAAAHSALEAHCARESQAGRDDHGGATPRSGSCTDARLLGRDDAGGVTRGRDACGQQAPARRQGTCGTATSRPHDLRPTAAARDRQPRPRSVPTPRRRGKRTNPSSTSARWGAGLATPTGPSSTALTRRRPIASTSRGRQRLELLVSAERTRSTSERARYASHRMVPIRANAAATQTREVKGVAVP